jgi:hypothetical protein
MRYLLILILIGCSSSKYQVVDKLESNLYHLHNPKTNGVEILSTEQKLIVGEWYSIKKLNSENRKNK